MKGTYICIWGYVVMVAVEHLDVYSEWSKFQEEGIAREEELSERKEIFVETLVNEGKVLVPSDSETIPTDLDLYFDWFFMKTDPKAETVPTMEDMHCLQQALGDEQFGRMSVYERELFATGYKCPLVKEAELTRQQYFEWLGNPKQTVEDRKMVLFRSWFEENQRQAVSAQGFAVQNMFSNDEKDKWRSISYTYGAQDKLGYEVVIVNAGKNSGALLAQLVSERLDHGGFKLELPFDVAGYTVGPQDHPLRAMAVEVDPDSPLFNAMLAAKNRGMTRAVQVYIGDKNNILPLEDGYDADFVQEYTLSEEV